MSTLKFVGDILQGCPAVTQQHGQMKKQIRRFTYEFLPRAGGCGQCDLTMHMLAAEIHAALGDDVLALEHASCARSCRPEGARWISLRPLLRRTSRAR